MSLTTVQFKILDDRIGQEFALPNYATSGSAGLDLFACVQQDTELAPNQTRLIPSGLAVYLADPNYAATLLPRSGLGHKHGIILGNCVGLIDSDYQGELKISCWNRSNQTFIIKPGMRIAQLMIVPIVRPNWQQVEDFDATARGVQGFGSTGQQQKLSTELSTNDTP